MEKKTHGFTMPNGDTHVFIPPAPTETERGGIIAKEKTTESVEAAVGKDGKLYVPAADETLTKEDAAVGRVLKILAVNDDGTFKVGWADEAGGDVTDVKIDGKSILNNGVAEIPIADASTKNLGMIRVDVGNSFDVSSDGTLRFIECTDDNLNKRFPRILTGKNIDDITKKALCSPISENAGIIDDLYYYPAWSAEEQAAARERLGISTNTIADIFCPEFEAR